MKSPLYSAIKKSLTGRFLTYIVQFLCLAVYARVFTPEQFGIIASIQVFVIFFQMLADVGIGPAIINEDKFESNQRDGVFSFTLILGFCLALVFYFFSYFLNVFYNGYEYQNIALMVSVSIVFYSLSMVPVTSLNKDAQFIKIAKANSVAELCSLLVVYVLFLSNFGVLALAAKGLAQSVFRFTLVYYQSSSTSMGRPCFGSEIYHVKKLARFASYQFGFNFINYFSRNLDNVLIAKYFGTTSLGVYEKAYQLMRYPLMLTTFGMAPAIQPILTKVRHDIESVVEEHNKLAGRLLFMSVLISGFLFLNSENIVLIIFGSQWNGIVPLIEIFSFMIPIQAVLSTSGSFFQVMNKPRWLFISGSISAVFNIVAIGFGVYFYDMELVAKLLVVSFTLNFIQSYYFLFRFAFSHSMLSFYKSLLRPVALAITLVAAYFLCKEYGINYIVLNSIGELIVNLLVALIVLICSIKFVKNIIIQ